MDIKEFKSFRIRMNKTQNQMSQLLGVSVKAVQGYEQGWRNIPGNNARHGNFSPVIFAGLSTEPIAVVMLARTGKRK